MSIVSKMKPMITKTLQDLYGWEGAAGDLTINSTKPEFEGDYTLVLFGFVKQLKKSPEVLGNEIGERLTATYPELFRSFNVIKGFLNLTIADAFWLNFIRDVHTQERFGYSGPNGKKVIVEYSSPNTNKPIHLGHLRNNFLGWSVAEIMKANGYDVFKTCVVNDRGIHICKSMIAWQLFANGATPQSEGIKGDHFVGDYYVRFNDEYKRQVDELVAGGKTKIAINLANLKYMNSSGLNTMIQLLTKARNDGGEVVICNMNKKINELLLITKLNTLFKVVETEDEAVSFLSK